MCPALDLYTSIQNWQVYPDWPSGHPDGPALETQDTFDGLGQPTRRVDHRRHDDTYVSDLLLPGSLNETQEQILFSCEADRSTKENPLYQESSIEIDGRSAKLGITKVSSSGRVDAQLCFALSDEHNTPLRVVAICRDHRALETALQVFRSITFKGRH